MAKRMFSCLWILAFVACADTTGPTGTVVLHFVQAMPGVADGRLSLDGAVLADPFGVGDVVTDTTSVGEKQLRLTGNGVDLEQRLDYAFAGYEYVLILQRWNSSGPLVFQTYTEPTSQQGMVMLRVINAVPGDPVSITLEGGVSVGMPYGATSLVSLDAGTYHVLATSPVAVDLGTVLLQAEQHFLVVLPGPDGEAASVAAF